MVWAKRHWRLMLATVVVIVLIGFVVQARRELLEVLLIVRMANLWWIGAALLVQSVVYLCFAAVYWRSLHLLGFHVRLLSMYGVAFVAIFLGRVFPAGGTSTFAFLLFQLRRRGIPDGTGAVAVTLDGLSYLLAFLALLAGGFVYLFTHGELNVRQVQIVALLTLAILALAMYVWGLSRDRALLTRRALSVKNGLARLLRRRWSDTRLLAFVAELYEGVALIGRDRQGFVQLVLLQFVALLLDCLTLLLLFYAVQVTPHVSVVLLGYSLAYFFSTVSSLPGGGGTFEAMSVVTMTNLGINGAIALSVTLLYRLLAFWLPLLISAVIYRQVHYHNEGPPRRRADLPPVPLE